MVNGVTGKILWVNLTTQTIREESVPDWVYEKYLAGIGLAAYYLLERIPAGADSLGPENILAFVPGLLTANGTLMTGRWMAAAKSPLTQTWGDANCGATLAPAIKQCGYDGIFFEGISPKPVYLNVTHQGAELLDASDLWGKDARETETILQARAAGKKPQVACIGPSGENLSLISGIVNDQGRLAARSGLGAVMGSKKLKAIALAGSFRTTAADKTEVKKLNQRFLKVVHVKPPFFGGKGMRFLGNMVSKMPLVMRMDGILYKIMLQKWGTISMNEYSLVTGDAPVKNWAGSTLEFDKDAANPINPDGILAYEVSKYHCYSCPIGCGGYCKYENGLETHKPEYETILALGGLLMNKDLSSLFQMNEKFNRAGMDTISAGGAIAMAIEAFEAGKLTLVETGGLELTWGNTDAIVKLADQMITRKGLGDLLADGAKSAAEKLGKGLDKKSMHSGGQELPMHDGRGDPGFALHYAVEPTPGRHTIGSNLYYDMYRLWKKSKKVPKPYPMFFPRKRRYLASEENAAIAAANSQLKMVVDGAGLCLFGSFIGLDRIPLFEWLNAVTGWKKSPDDYLAMGRDIQTLRQKFNARQNAPLRHDINPRVIGAPPLEEGPNKGMSIPLDELVPMYWRVMRWDESSGEPLVTDPALPENSGEVV